MSIKGRYAAIKPNDVVDGEGICVSFWVQGCPFHCKGCHNPDTWDFEGGHLFSEDTIQEILGLISKNGIVRNFSVLGGEPLCPENLSMTKKVMESVRNRYPQIMLYLWTGYVYESLSDSQKDALQFVDVLIDGPFQLEHRNITLKFRGSPNQRIILLKKGESACC